MHDFLEIMVYKSVIITHFAIMRNIIKHQINAWIKKVDVSSKAEYQRLFDAVINERLYVNQHLDRDSFAAHMEKRKTINEVAWAVGLTPDNLRRLFRQQIGITPTEYKMKN